MSQTEMDKLLEVWKVLETLTVSLDRMGWFSHAHGEEQAKDALHEYMSPALVKRMAHARRLIIEVMEVHDPEVMDRLEALRGRFTTVAPSLPIGGYAST